MMIDEKDKLYALIEQCKSIDAKITSYHVISARILGIGMAIVSAILAVSVKEKNYTILLLLPIALYAIFFYWLNINSWILAQGGYKKYLEEKINTMCHEPLFLWETGVVPKRHINLSNTCLNVLYVIILLLFSAISIWAAFKLKKFFILSIVINLALLLILIISFLNLNNAFMNSYNDSKKIEKRILKEMTS